MNKKPILIKFGIALAALFHFAGIFTAQGQKVTNYNLVKLLRENKLETDTNQHTTVLDGTKHAISTFGIVWLKDVSFKDGTIDIDLRGKDVFLKSFVGVAFHAKDTTAYETIFFRPFRFHNADTVTRRWSVQYMSLPGNDYAVLRKTHPFVYENQVNPVPNADDWFHATIIIKDSWITVYVNQSTIPSLKIKSLNELTAGKIGLWSSPGSLTSDFANLSITE